MATPRLILEIQGKREINDAFIRDDLTIDEKSEISPKVLDTDGWVELNVASVSPVNMLMVETPVISSTNNFTNTLRLVIQDGVNPQYNIDLPVSGLQIFNFPDSFGSYIKNVQFSTDSTEVEQVVKSRIYSL